MERMAREERMTSPRSVQQNIKRCIDIVVSSLMLVLLSPLLVLIALAIFATSGVPIFYRWNVVGERGRRFTGWKFRTMVKDADKIKPNLMVENEMRGPVFKMRDDPRITRIGRILRRFSLDELPQLWSVLKGDMSFVGPRPPLEYEYDRFSEWQKQKLAIKPGMTSLWHIRGKPRDFDDWVRLDLEYIDHWSLWLDAKILLNTAIVVLTGKNY
jgi:lipopolysaccharide/colanic/teichoic acid biosynthesis glycosyltransferase